MTRKEKIALIGRYVHLVDTNKNLKCKIVTFYLGRNDHFLVELPIGQGWAFSKFYTHQCYNSENLVGTMVWAIEFGYNATLIPILQEKLKKLKI